MAGDKGTENEEKNKRQPGIYTDQIARNLPISNLTRQQLADLRNTQGVEVIVKPSGVHSETAVDINVHTMVLPERKPPVQSGEEG